MRKIWESRECRLMTQIKSFSSPDGYFLSHFYLCFGSHKDSIQIQNIRHQSLAPDFKKFMNEENSENEF